MSVLMFDTGNMVHHWSCSTIQDKAIIQLERNTESILSIYLVHYPMSAIRIILNSSEIATVVTLMPK